VADQITLRLPSDPEFQRVAHLVLSGLALRLDLTVENLEDLQLAVDAVFDRAVGGDGGQLVVTLCPGEGELQARVGPVPTPVLDELEREPAADDGSLSLRRVLDTTVDDVLVDGDTVVLTKRVAGGG
jgi:hypothetical protein